MRRVKTTYRANGHSYFCAAVIKGSCSTGGPIRVFRSMCRAVTSEGRGPGRNSCAGCLFRGNLSGVLGGIKRRTARIIVTTGGPSIRRIGCRLSSFLCRTVILVMRGKVA